MAGGSAKHAGTASVKPMSSVIKASRKQRHDANQWRSSHGGGFGVKSYPLGRLTVVGN